MGVWVLQYQLNLQKVGDWGQLVSCVYMPNPQKNPDTEARATSMFSIPPCGHTLWLEEVSTIHTTLMGKDTWKLMLVSLGLFPAPLQSAGLKLYPLAVISHNHEDNSELYGSFQQIIRSWTCSWGSPKGSTVIRSEGGLGDHLLIL